MAQDCNQRIFGTGLSASIRPPRTGLSASEPAINRLGLQSTVVGPHYRQLDDAFGHPFPSVRAFCVTPPPHGAGIAPSLLDALAQETRDMTLGQKVAEVQARAQALAADPAIQPLNPNGGDRKQDISVLCHNTDERGTSAPYLVKRLKRDAPQIAEALARGEFPSVRAAAKAAGIDNDHRRLWLSENPEKAAKALSQKYDAAYLRALINALLDVLP